MKSLPLGTYAKIPVKIHWSFAFILLFIAYVIISENLSFTGALGLVFYIIALFLSVVLHEFGHALMARRYDIDTQDIILTPIGGLARLTRMPHIPRQEIMVALAGPFVNLIIIGIILIFFFALGIGISAREVDIHIALTNPIGFLYMVLVMNGVLFLFNMIPAFPMDGGRVLRAVLNFKFSRLKATQIASFIGQIFAVGFIIFGFYNKILSLSFIGIFIYSMARREYNMMKKLHNANL